MKFFKAFSIVLLFIVSVLTMISVFVPEVDDKLETTIDRPLMVVYASMLNTHAMPDWVNGLENVEYGESSLAMPGSVFKLHYKGTETHTVQTLEVLELVPLRSVRFKLYDDMVEMVVSMEFESVDSGTKIDAYVQMKGKGFVSRAFLPLLKSVIMEEGRKSMINLKKLQES